ncbi:MAG: MGMT family protein [Gammaproteobacteria bacterium]|nr:MGMT family protein [Gammaproteobacteria bacterium]
MATIYDAIYDMVRRIPSGRVATYGLIAQLVDRPRGARQVGYALGKLCQDSDVPWHRVVNAQGRISPRGLYGSDDLQRLLLESEHVEFDQDGRIDLKRYLWTGRASQ